MTVSMLTGLVIQATALWIIHIVIKGTWLRRPGALFAAAAVLGHGITEVMQWVWPGRNPFRSWIGQPALDDWILLASVAILMYAIVYAVVVSRLPAEHSDQNPAEQIKGMSLKILVAITAPLLILTWEGRGALQPVAVGESASRDNYATVGLASTFLVPLASVIGAIVLVRYGTRWMVPLFVVQGAFLSLAGTRSLIITACLLSLVGASLCNVRPTRKQVALVVVLMAFFTVLISATRSVAGRETFTAEQSAGERLDGLIEGVGSLGDKESRDAVLNDVVYRFDSNTYGAMILEGLRNSDSPVGLRTVGNAIMLTVPSFLDTQKLSKSLEDRNEEAYLDRHFGIPQGIDWLPGTFGAMLAYYGPVGLPIFAMVLGLLAGVLEHLLRRTPTNARFVASVGAAQCALLYAAGTHDIIIQLRAVLLSMALFWAIGVGRRTLNRYGWGQPTTGLAERVSG